MATLTPATAARSANPITFTGASPGGDEFANTGKELLLVRHTNTGGVGVTLTVTSQATVDGLAVEDRTVVIDPGETHVLGPWPKAAYNDANGNVALSWSSTTDVEVAVIG